jgi:hypothetical protein
MNEMNIEYIPLGEIKPYENNPRINDDAVKYVVNSIKEFGFKVPIIVDKDNVIVAGHTRFEAAKNLGLEKVPCIRANDLSENQVKAFRIADNKVSEFSRWDLEKLGEEINFLNLENFNLSEFGFSDFELSVFNEDIMPEKFDKTVEENFPPNLEGTRDRVIITFKKEDKEKVCKFLGLGENKLCLVYNFEDLKIEENNTY